MLTLSPVLGFFAALKMVAGFAAPLVVGIAGALLCRRHTDYGVSLILAAVLILVGGAGPLVLSDELRPAAMGLLPLACNAGWFVAGLALVLLGLRHRTHDARRIRAGH